MGVLLHCCKRLQTKERTPGQGFQLFQFFVLSRGAWVDPSQQRRDIIYFNSEGCQVVQVLETLEIGITEQFEVGPISTISILGAPNIRNN